MSLLASIGSALGRWTGRLLRRVALPALTACVAGYFAYTAIYGERGILALRQIKQQTERAEQQLAEVKAERLRVQQRVDLLRSGGLDRDMLDQRAREILNLSHPDDVIILLPHEGEIGQATGEPTKIK